MSGLAGARRICHAQLQPTIANTIGSEWCRYAGYARFTHDETAQLLHSGAVRGFGSHKVAICRKLLEKLFRGCVAYTLDIIPSLRCRLQTGSGLPLIFDATTFLRGPRSRIIKDRELPISQKQRPLRHRCVCVVSSGQICPCYTGIYSRFSKYSSVDCSGVGGLMGARRSVSRLSSSYDY